MKYCKVYYGSVNDRDSNAIEFNSAVDGKSKASILAESLQCKLELENIYDVTNIEIPDLLIIEDEFVNIYNCLNQLGGYLDIICIESVAVITKSKVLNEFLTKTSNLFGNPSCITLDFNLDDLEIGQVTFTEMASQNYDNLKVRFPDTPIMALTNFSFDHFSKDLVEKIRTHNDSVMQKTLNFWMSYPLLVHDKMEIAKLTNRVGELEERLNESENKKDQVFIKQYFGGLPVSIETISSYKVNGKTPQEILAEFNLSGGTSIAWKCPFFSIGTNLKSSFYLVTGSSGTGKKEIANIIHRLAGKQGVPVYYNCSDLEGFDVNVAQIKLFGAEGGKITDVKRSEGLLDMIKGEGTLCLDEFHKLPIAVQNILLTVLDDGIYRPADGGKPKQLGKETKIVFVTDQNIKELISSQPPALLPQLYYRISKEAEIKIPSLNDLDKTEFKLIACKVLEKANKKHQKQFKLDKSCIDKLFSFDYSNGNIRKLEGIITKALTLCTENKITPDWLIDSSNKITDSLGSIEYSSEVLNEKKLQLKRISTAITDLAPEKPTQSNIAAKMGVSQSQISQYFTQDSNPEKISVIIIKCMLEKDDILNLLKLNLFKTKFGHLCNQYYSIDIN